MAATLARQQAAGLGSDCRLLLNQPRPRGNWFHYISWQRLAFDQLGDRKRHSSTWWEYRRITTV